MTATVIMQLVEDGRLALDDPVDRWVPELRGVAQTITIEHLLAHQAGLEPPTEREMQQLGADSSRLLQAVASRPLAFDPGTRSDYSNEGYVALGLGSPADPGPGLRGGPPDPGVRPHRHGIVQPVRPVRRPRVRRSPGRLGPVLPPVDPTRRERGRHGGGRRRLLSDLWSGRLVGADAVAPMRALRGYVGAWTDYGFGLARERFSCGTAIGHAGRLNGVGAEEWTLDEGDRSTVVLVNDHVSLVAPVIADAALCG